MTWSGRPSQQVVAMGEEEEAKGLRRGAAGEFSLGWQQVGCRQPRGALERSVSYTQGKR